MLGVGEWEIVIPIETFRESHAGGNSISLNKSLKMLEVKFGPSETGMRSCKNATSYL